MVRAEDGLTFRNAVTWMICMVLFNKALKGRKEAISVSFVLIQSQGLVVCKH